MSGENSFIDVHVFDGKWTHDIQARFILSQKDVLFRWLRARLSRINIPLTAIQGVELVINNTGSSRNYDPINKVSADDILAEICWILVDREGREDITDYLLLLSEQMSDMYRLGQCPQGRSLRLIQIYKSLSK